MPLQNTASEVGDRPQWILRLLYAPVRGTVGVPIVGATRLMKACFLLDRKLDEEVGAETDFQFRPDKYGPLDPKVYDAIEVLEEDHLIRQKESVKYEGTEYLLTEMGERCGEELFMELSTEEQELITWIKGKHVLNSLSKLLSFVYNQYPEMAENSELV